MSFTVPIKLKRAGELVSANVRIGGPMEAALIQQWPRYIVDGATASAKEAAEYARDSAERWRMHHGKNCAVCRIEEFSKNAATQPREDLAILLVIDSGWWSEGADLIAFAYFRRTWTGNLYMEYLAKHPLTANKGLPELFVGGVTEGILVGLSELLSVLNDGKVCDSWIWWEATEGSSQSYQKFFAPTVPEDLVIISEKELAGCASRIVHERWASLEVARAKVRG